MTDYITTFLFIHFTSLLDANKIAKSLTLRAGCFGGVYAVVEGGEVVEGVQLTTMGVKSAGIRDYAVIFRTATKPDSVFPEEAYWAADEISLIDAVVVTREEAQAILDGSQPFDENDLTVDVPMAG